MKTEFNLLNLTKSASWDDIKKAYREKMKENHPDLNCENTMMIQQANNKSKDINAAYSKLKSCLSQTGRFICPSFTIKKKEHQQDDIDPCKTNVADFFKPRNAVVYESQISWGSVFFNVFLIALWGCVLVLGTIRGLEYFETHSIANLMIDLKRGFQNILASFR